MKSASYSVFFLALGLVFLLAGTAQASDTDAPASVSPSAVVTPAVPASTALTSTASMASASTTTAQVSSLSPTPAVASALTTTASSALSSTAGAQVQSAPASGGTPAPADAAVLPPGAPALPDVQAGGKQSAGDQRAEPVAQNAIPAPGKAQEEIAPSPFKFTNFLYGFLGGALVGASYGVLFDTSGKNNVRNIKAGLYGLLGGTAFGTLSLFLGATTPETAKPPQVGSGRLIPDLQLAYRF